MDKRRKLVLVLNDEVGEKEITSLAKWGKEYDLEVLDFADRTKILVEVPDERDWGIEGVEKYEKLESVMTEEEWIESWFGIIASENEDGIAGFLVEVVPLEKWTGGYFSK